MASNIPSRLRCQASLSTGYAGGESQSSCTGAGSAYLEEGAGAATLVTRAERSRSSVRITGRKKDILKAKISVPSGMVLGFTMELCGRRMSSVLIGVIVAVTLVASAGAGTVGINYGRVADNLPSAFKVVQLIKSQGIDKVKLYDADPTVLRALNGSGMKVTIDLPNEQLYYVARRLSRAYDWVLRNVVAYVPGTQINAIAVGNEVFANPNNLASYLVPAMTNIHRALMKYNLDGDVKVSSPIALSALGNSYPPSAGVFKPDLSETVMKPMLDFLNQTGSYLMVNAYPFFAYKDNSDVISLDYALFRPNAGVVDEATGIRYTNLFDAQLDAVFSAMSVLNHKDLDIVVTETGWPSKGDEDETGVGMENAATYNGNLVKHVLSSSGTPLRPKASLDTFLFALFNENKKPGPTSERNYGLFYPSESKVYDIALTADALKNQPPTRQKPTNIATKHRHSSASNGGVGSETWCVAKSQADSGQLQAALDYACGEGSADCQQIQPGAPCYNPNTLASHASYAFNSYYQKNGRKTGTCDFAGAAYVVTQAPIRATTQTVTFEGNLHSTVVVVDYCEGFAETIQFEQCLRHITSDKSLLKISSVIAIIEVTGLEMSEAWPYTSNMNSDLGYGKCTFPTGY
eukprot:Gb_17031 [translate_table: standard]